MTSFGYRLNLRFTIKECSSCGALYTRNCSCSKGSVEDKILVPEPPKNCARCAKCGHPVNGPYCQGCALLREKHEEDLVSYFQNFQNTSESSDDSTNVVNAPREPIVVKQDHSVNPPHIDKCCCECGNALDGIFCQQCICKSCGKGAHTGYNCPLKVLIISNPEPCNQTMNNELPQTLPSFDSMCYSDKENSKQEEKRIEEEQAANAQYWKIPACYDDDDDYNSAITPVLSTEETDNSLSMGDEHLDTIPATESDKVIKSSVEDLVPIPSESEGENGCNSLHNEDVSEKIFSNPLFEEETTSIRIDQHHFNAESDLVESMLNRDSSVIFSSSKIDSLLDEFVGELTLLKSILPGIDKADFHPNNEIRFSERLLYDNSSPRPPKEFVFENSNAKIKCFSPSPILIEDSDSHMEEIDLSFNPDDPMPPSIEDDDNDTEGDNLFLERLLHDDPIPLSDTLDFSNVVRVFLPFFTYPVTSSLLLSSGSEVTIFEPGISHYDFSSFNPDLSHRCGTFKKFNTHRSHLNESPMKILFSTCTPMDQ
nr:hypothetical protein [Tanacetum cinerariifolium]